MSNRLASLFTRLDDDENSPIERLETINEILDVARDDFFDMVVYLVVPILQEAYLNFKKLGDVSSISYIKSICETYNIRINIHDIRPTPYEDKESVHIFMQDTRQIVEWLTEKYPPEDYVRPPSGVFDDAFIDFIEKAVIPAIDRYTLVDIFTSVTKFIRLSDYEEELTKILNKEMKDAKDTCTSGHLSAMVNAIAGFPGVPTFKGNSFEHQKAAIFNLLNNALNFEDLHNLDEAVKRIINGTDISKVAQVENLPKILKDYTEVNWELKDGKVYYT